MGKQVWAFMFKAWVILPLGSRFVVSASSLSVARAYPPTDMDARIDFFVQDSNLPIEQIFSFNVSLV